MKGYNFVSTTIIQSGQGLQLSASPCRCLLLEILLEMKGIQTLFWQPSLQRWPVLVIWISTLCRRHIFTYGKIKTYCAKTFSHMPPSIYLNMVVLIIRFINVVRLQRQHLSLSLLFTVHRFIFTVSRFYIKNARKHTYYIEETYNTN